MHKGLDFGAGVGTPIMAAGDGAVTFAGDKGSYGRYVQLKHPAGFATAYAHMSRIAVKRGQTVRQGQVIGYVGTSGRSTGPHLHYEVKVNDNYVDPLGIRLPSNRELDRTQLAEFKRERDRIDDLIRQSSSSNPAADRTIR
jgi:murein DD-endopeptidase MepM/ murein hydrolase activator NlpD